MEWKLAEAKNRFSEVVQLAMTQGPQRVHRRADTVIVIAESEYERLLGKKLGFKEFLMQGPSFEGLDLKRDKSPDRDIPL